MLDINRIDLELYTRHLELQAKCIKIRSDNMDNQHISELISDVILKSQRIIDEMEKL